MTKATTKHAVPAREAAEFAHDIRQRLASSSDDPRLHRIAAAARRTIWTGLSMETVLQVADECRGQTVQAFWEKLEAACQWRGFRLRDALAKVDVVDEAHHA